MAWLARSIANSLKLDDDDDDAEVNNDKSSKDPKPEPESDQIRQIDSQSSSSTTTPRGVKEDLSELTKTLTRQFWGVASFLAPPPDSVPPQPSDQSTPRGQSDPEEESGSGEEAVIAGIRSDFAEIGGKVRTGISKLSSNIAVSGITKMASNFLQFGSEEEGRLGSYDAVVGVTEEVVTFARDIAMHPETWMDFPMPDDEDFDDFDMSDAQQEHALAVERLAPRLAALRLELCPGYMSEDCFWKIYFVLLHSRLSKRDAEVLSTSQIVEARAMLTHELQSQSKAKLQPDFSQSGISHSGEIVDLPDEESLYVPPQTRFESSGPKISSIGAASSSVAADIETEKHPVQSTDIQVIDKSVIEEGHVKLTKHQHSPSSSSSQILDEKFEDDGDDWLKEESAEIVGGSGTAVPLGNDDDVSFSDLEDDDGDVPSSWKKAASGSDTSTKDSRDWVQLSRSSADSVKDINSVGDKGVGSEQVSAHNPDMKEPNDWLDVNDIDVM